MVDKAVDSAHLLCEGAVNTPNREITQHNALVSGAETRDDMMRCLLDGDPSGSALTANRVALARTLSLTPFMDGTAGNAVETQEKKMNISDDIAAQDQYVESLSAQNFDYSLVVAEAFVRGMRDVGYKHTGTAIDELIDNSIQAGAKNILVFFGFQGANTTGKPQQIVVVDDGHGMKPSMLRAAVLWGGGHRENSRELFGRYGFGLPSSCVSQGQRFEVFSKIADGELHSISVDLEDIKEGKFYRENNHPVAPPAKLATLPAWVTNVIEKHFGAGKWNYGTVIVIDKLDKLKWKTTSNLERELLEHFGTTYRNYLRSVTIKVNEKVVEAVDPMFLDPTARFYDENHLRAEAQTPIDVPVKDRETGEVLGVVKVRFSYLPPGFQNRSADPLKRDGSGRSKESTGRFKIMSENEGVLILRAGRQIDVLTNPKWYKFINYDRQFRVEIDYPPSLDEEFGITTSKQQMVLSDRMWELLESAGVKRIMLTLRRRAEKEYADAHNKQEEPENKEDVRFSEKIMKEASQYKTAKPQVSPEQARERKQRVEKEVEEQAKSTGKPKEEVERQIQAEIINHPYRLKREHMPEGPFYRTDLTSPTVDVYINTAHPFYHEVYLGPNSTPRYRAALELMLFTMTECEMEASPERQLFYKAERQEWSRRFQTVFTLLEQNSPKSEATPTPKDNEVNNAE